MFSNFAVVIWVGVALSCGVQAKDKVKDKLKDAGIEKLEDSPHKGEIGLVKIMDFRPSQDSVGEIEVHIRVENKLSKMSSKELANYLMEPDHRIPIIIAPNGEFYVIDHHHLLRALYEMDEAGIQNVKSAVAQVVESFEGKNMTMPEFWKTMIEKNWVYLYDQNGDPIKPNELPHDISKTRDAPYRSVSYGVQRAGGYKKTKKPFSEYKWANALQRVLKIKSGMKGYYKAVKEGVKWALSPEAKGLPGYIKSCGENLENPKQN